MTAMPEATERLLAEVEADHIAWRHYLFPKYVTDERGRAILDAPHHREFWDWTAGIRKGERSRPFIGLWNRGGAKSTSAELATVYLAALRRRRYGLYVSATQDSADSHVETIGGMLESPRFGVAYPATASRRLSKYGHSRGWRVNRLATSSGFTLDAIGLDKAIRGRRQGEDRPDLIIIDDIDDALDTPGTTEKKITAITKKILPAGSQDLVVIAIQNLVHERSFFAQLATRELDVLTDAILSGPVPAVWDLETRPRPRGEGHEITSGKAAWIGFDLQAAQAALDNVGLSAFLSEYQHDVEPPPGGIFDHLDLEAIRVTEADLPELQRVTVWVDPAVTSTDSSDSQAIQVDGLGIDRKVYRLFSYEARTTPLDALSRAIRKAVEYGADTVGVETDQGGDTWESVYREASRHLVAAGQVRERQIPRFKQAKAGSGHGPKTHRAMQMLSAYERGHILHVEGPHLRTLERALRRFPKTKPYDLVDATYWAWWDLTRGGELAASAPIPAREGSDPYAARRRSVLADGLTARP